MKTILYLDDSNCSLRLMDRVLKDHSRVLCCPTMAEAGAMMEEHSVDLFVIDLMLGDGDGITFASRVRSIERYAKTPIILVSAGITQEIAHRAIRHQVNQCVSKPFAPAEIKAVIDAQLTEPTIHKVDCPRITIFCAAWEADNVYYQYSLDTGRRVSAATRDEAHAQMHDALADWVRAQGDSCEPVLEAHVARHHFDVG
jgi:DNA-binding response OmpR family regulator